MKKRLFITVLTLLICLALLPTSVLAAPWFITFTGDLEAEYEVAEGGSLTLTVAAKIGNTQNPMGWTYSYQWYKKNILGIMFVQISGATGGSYSIPSASKMYSAGQYYCKVTATHTDGTTLSESSTTATVRVVDAAAAQPVITSPTSVYENWFVQNGSELSLEVEAHSPDGGTLSYQWFSNQSDSYAGAAAISGATSNVYAPPTTAAGFYHYYCQVTNTASALTNSANSLIWGFTVNASGSIVSVSESETYAAGEPVTLSCTAVSPDPEAMITYRWSYETEPGSWIMVSDQSTHAVDTSAAGAYQFCCVVKTSFHGFENALEPAYVTITVTEAPEMPGTETPAIPGTEEPYRFPFTDVADSAWYRGDVEIAHKNGLINGKTDTTYAPDDNMTVAEAIKLAACMHQLYHDGTVTLANGSPYWYGSYVEYALTNGIIDGAYPDYSAQIIRLEFVHIFYHALPYTEYAEINLVADNSIPDVRLTDTYGGEIYAFYRAGILIGNDSNGTFSPVSSIRRSEVAAILTRMFDRTARRSITLP